MKTKKPTKKFVEETAKKAGKEMLKYFGKVKVTDTKTSSIDVLTKADLISEKIIVDSIKKEYPTHGIISEESSDYNTDLEYVWVIDPIDGTDNFVNSNPMFGIILGVMKNKEMYMSGIYLPYMDEFFFAKRGSGAFLNNKKIECSKITTLNGTKYILNGWHDTDILKKEFEVLKNAKDKTCICSAFSSAAVVFAYLASGRKDWHITKNFTLWDIGVPSLICQEAGVDIKYLDGSDFELFKEGIILIANPKLNKTIRSYLK